MELRKRLTVPFVMALSVFLAAGAALAQSPPANPAWVALGDNAIYSNSLRALVILFVLAVLIESALAVIFNWRLYLALFYSRGVKTLVMIAVSALVVWSFNLDIVYTLLDVYGFPSESGTLSRLLTALILAGGSSGVYRVLVALGYREAKAPEEVRPTPKKAKAWISVRVTRKAAVGPIYVRIRDDGAITSTSPANLACVIAPEGFWRTVWSVFFLSHDRFPQAGGYELDIGRQYTLEVAATDSSGQTIPCGINGPYTFADGAIINFRISL